MGKLIYSAIASLDGYVEDETGDFRWAAPDEEVFGFINDLERPIGTYLYGRRMYETMQFWETEGTGEDSSQASRDFGHMWRAAEKVVYSRTLAQPSSPRTSIERDFDAEGVRALKAASGSDLTIGGANLAGQALTTGLVDECHLFLTPIVLGGGKSALSQRIRARLELLDERRFGHGVVHLHYRIAGA